MEAATGIVLIVVVAMDADSDVELTWTVVDYLGH